jgi:hypothetical protein
MHDRPIRVFVAPGVIHHDHPCHHQPPVDVQAHQPQRQNVLHIIHKILPMQRALHELYSTRLASGNGVDNNVDSRLLEICGFELGLGRMAGKAIPPIWFVICWGLFSALFVCAGALLAIDPSLFVRIMRRASFGDSYIKTVEWEKSVVGLEGRMGGCVFFCFGLGGFYVLLQMIHVI